MFALQARWPESDSKVEGEKGYHTEELHNHTVANTHMHITDTFVEVWSFATLSIGCSHRAQIDPGDAR